MVGFCDYRNNNKKRHGQVEETEDKKLGFRLWSSGPNFDTDLPQDVSGVVGQTAYLTCRVFDRTNKTVRFIISYSKNCLRTKLFCDWTIVFYFKGLSSKRLMDITKISFVTLQTILDKKKNECRPFTFA